MLEWCVEGEGEGEGGNKEKRNREMWARSGREDKRGWKKGMKERL